MAKPGQVAEVAALPWRVGRSFWLLLEALGEVPKAFGPCGHPHSPCVLLATCISACLSLPAYRYVCRSALPPAFLVCWWGSAYLSPACLACIPSVHLLIFLPVGLRLTCYLPTCCLLAASLSSCLLVRLEICHLRRHLRVILR